MGEVHTGGSSRKRKYYAELIRPLSLVLMSFLLPLDFLQPPPSKAARYENPLPLPQSRLLFPMEHEATLSKCQTVGDLYTNLATLATPGRTLSLLRNRATFLLLFANSKANEVQARFSVTLYHTLYNEFFGCVDRKAGNLDRQSYLLRRAHLGE